MMRRASAATSARPPRSRGREHSPQPRPRPGYEIGACLAQVGRRRVAHPVLRMAHVKAQVDAGHCSQTLTRPCGRPSKRAVYTARTNRASSVGSVSAVRWVNGDILERPDEKSRDADQHQTLPWIIAEPCGVGPMDLTVSGGQSSDRQCGRKPMGSFLGSELKLNRIAACGEGSPGRGLRDVVADFTVKNLVGRIARRDSRSMAPRLFL